MQFFESFYLLKTLYQKNGNIDLTGLQDLLGLIKSLNNIVLLCLLNSFYLAVNLQFFIDIFNVFSHGARGKKKMVGDYGIAQTLTQLF